jgi:hypothetical protein
VVKVCCDRCGEETTSKYYTVDIGQAMSDFRRVEDRWNLNPDILIVHNRALCPKCYEKLMVFLDNKPTDVGGPLSL